MDDEKLMAATAEVLTLLRAWYRSAPEKRRRLAASANLLKESVVALKAFPPGSGEHRRARQQIDQALNDACHAMHHNESFASIFGSSITLLRRIKDGR